MNTTASEYEGVPTAAIADASVRLGLPVRWAPPSLRPLLPGTPSSGPARPVTHLGSVDTILEVIAESDRGDVLVIDNGGRRDEACVGDLLVAEAALAGIAGIVLWGAHRDTAQLRRIGLPLWSLGPVASGPRRIPPAAPPMRTAALDSVPVTVGDAVVADDDGVAFIPPTQADQVLQLAGRIQRVEAAQADLIRQGRSLRDQLDFTGYLQRRTANPSLTLRQHLEAHGSALEA
ncbi:RraA family protein [Streptomyces parvulus]|uniref:RraA family protein n=1 Tax=Streptomyces parvulus TaxID=146923 RepID=UPI00339EBBEA